MTILSCPLENGRAAPFAGIPVVPLEDFSAHLVSRVRQGARLCALVGMEAPMASLLQGLVASPAGQVRLLAILAHDSDRHLSSLATDVGDRYPALTPSCPQAHMFERELAEQWRLVPEGHPWLRPARFQPSLRTPAADAPPGVADFFRIEGEEIHQVAVGPVHAGVIEPGHFRFQCHGEKVFHLEISLGYQHRGIEKALLAGPHLRTLYQMETLAGDTSVGHALAYCQVLEALAGLEVPPRAMALRALGLELERLANHTGDLGALAGDVGFLPTAAFCGRIRGDFLNMTAQVCGSRLGRGFVRPGGTGFDLEAGDRLAKLSQALARGVDDTRVAVDLLWDTPTVLGRFENTGLVSRKACQDLGLVGPAARACGFELDVRRDFPIGQYRTSMVSPVPNPELRTGDVAARAFVRWAEMKNSLAFLKDLLANLPPGPIRTPGAADRPANLARNALVVSLVEGWRGEICHVALTDDQGRFARYKVVDPSFHNWIGLGMALRDQEISDFPLCNKSFNLSYCGFDL